MADAIAEKELGNASYKKKDFLSAHKHYDEAIRLDPKNIVYYNNKAAVLFEEHKYGDCVTLCEKAVEIGRENQADYKAIAKAYARMGSAYMKQENMYEAKTYFNKSLSEHRNPDVVKKMQELDKVLKEKERLAYIDPNLAKEAKEQGNACFKKGDYAGAITHYKEAIARNPEDPVLYSNRAACYHKLMEFSLAVTDSEECIRIDPKFVKGYLRRGAALMAMKEFSRASDAYEKAMELDPNSKEAEEGLISTSNSLNQNPEEARKNAMNDPEIQAILGDPAMRMILEQMQQDPKAFREHLKDPVVAEKLKKLMSSGIVQVR